MSIKLLINGAEHALDVGSNQTLLSALRDQLDLTGTKYGCGEGQCGACTVLLDGKPVRSCQLPVGSTAGRKIVTIEGLEQDGRLHPVQQAFLKQEAFQCGYCTSGMILAAAALLDQITNPSETDIIRHMDGNICRCGTYPRILAAVRDAASAHKG
jgi:aerobic-type carbon monoxide dehydrogenase small subunit (CoxS/CutS family)